MRFSTVLLTFVSFTTVFGHVIARGKGDGGDECKEDCEYKSSMTSSYYGHPITSTYEQKPSEKPKPTKGPKESSEEPPKASTKSPKPPPPSSTSKYHSEKPSETPKPSKTPTKGPPKGKSSSTYMPMSTGYSRGKA